uniref:CX domain-containing protein n=1 Tax=Ascaris lumbricoides TaxID=6252 RepID=A0A0M3I0U8_ASCLU
MFISYIVDSAFVLSLSIVSCTAIRYDPYGIYHYDNFTDCEAVCAVKCETTQVIRNDVEERQQYSCRQRKPPLVSRLAHLSTSGTMTFLIIAAGIFIGLILILCCCCCRCCRCCRCKSCCKKEAHPHNSSNDPLVDGEFRETLDSKEIGYLKREASKKIITV